MAAVFHCDIPDKTVWNVKTVPRFTLQQEKLEITVVTAGIRSFLNARPQALKAVPLLHLMMTVARPPVWPFWPWPQFFSGAGLGTMATNAFGHVALFHNTFSCQFQCYCLSEINNWSLLIDLELHLDNKLFYWFKWHTSDRVCLYRVSWYVQSVGKRWLVFPVLCYVYGCLRA